MGARSCWLLEGGAGPGPLKRQKWAEWRRWAYNGQSTKGGAKWCKKNQGGGKRQDKRKEMHHPRRSQFLLESAISAWAESHCKDIHNPVWPISTQRRSQSSLLKCPQSIPRRGWIEIIAQHVAWVMGSGLQQKCLERKAYPPLFCSFAIEPIVWQASISDLLCQKAFTTPWRRWRQQSPPTVVHPQYHRYWRLWGCPHWNNVSFNCVTPDVTSALLP